MVKRRQWLQATSSLLATGWASPCLRAADAVPTVDWPGAPWQHAVVAPGKSLGFPRDFGAHPDYRTEWWYLTGWLDGRGFQITFFRTRTQHPGANPSRFAPTQLLFAHAALMLPAIGHPLHAERAARLGHPGTRASTADTDVAIGNWSLQRMADDRYRIQVRDARFSADLVADPRGHSPWLQGTDGYSRKGPGQDQASYYYSRPQLRLHGRLLEPSPDDADAVAGRAPGRLLPREVSGHAWFDHEWSTTLLDASASGWDWVGLNLDDGSALVAFRIRRRDGSEPIWHYAAMRDADGRTRPLSDLQFTPQRTWRSPRTRAEWPVAMQISAGGRRWDLKPLFDDQELDSRASTGNVYWEGAVTVIEQGRRIGAGYLELTGYHERLRL